MEAPILPGPLGRWRVLQTCWSELNPHIGHQSTSVGWLTSVGKYDASPAYGAERGNISGCANKGGRAVVWL